MMNEQEIETALTELASDQIGLETALASVKRNSSIAMIGMLGIGTLVLVETKLLMDLMKATGQIGQAVSAIISNGGVVPTVQARPQVVDETIPDVQPADEPFDPGPKEAPEKVKEALKKERIDPKDGENVA